MCMLSQVSELPCLTLPIRLVCPQADRKASKQNSCPWQYKMSLQRRLLTVTSDLPGACPLAYCPPGRGFSLDSNPRALPSVTQSSALQAPERQRESCNLTTHPHRTDALHSTLLPGRQYHDMMHHIALRCLEGSTMSNLVHRRRRCARIVPHSILLPGGQYARGQGRSLSPGVGNRCGSMGAFLYCQRQPFCFVAFRLPRADQTGGEVQSGKLACMDEHHRLAARA